jgi:hypothetical protein
MEFAWRILTKIPQPNFFSRGTAYQVVLLLRVSD